jgi:AcrR family transcriptional regulator
MPKMLPDYKITVQQRILDQAMNLIAEKGFANFTLEDIAKRLNVSKAALYGYFRSKQAIMEAIIKSTQDLFATLFTESFQGVDLREWPEAFFDNLFGEYNRNIFILLELMNEAKFNAELRDLLSADFSAHLAFLEIQLTQLQAQGIIRPDLDPTLLAQILYSDLLGIILNFAMGWDLPTLRAIWTENVKLFLQ